jgi:fructokinase
MSTEVLCFGEALWDLLPDGAVLGGAPLNLAYRLKSQGVSASIVSCLGKDKLGNDARQLISDYGMGGEFLFTHEELPTGTVVVELDDTGEPSYTIVKNTAYDDIPVTGELLEKSRSARCFCYGTLAQRDPGSRKTLRTLLANRGDGLNLLDINLRPECYSRESVDYSLKQAGILKINEEEAGTLKEWYSFDETDYRELAAAFCRRFDLLYCILTLGPKGACVASPDGPICQEPSYDVPRVDPCGAGDAFTAGFLASYLNGGEIAAACRRGNALGSAVTARRGALQSIPAGEAETLEKEGTPYKFKESDFLV